LKNLHPSKLNSKVQVTDVRQSQSVCIDNAFSSNLWIKTMQSYSMHQILLIFFVTSSPWAVKLSWQHSYISIF